MPTKTFDLQDVLKSGWENFKKAPVILIVLLLLALVSSLLVNLIFAFLPALLLSLLNSFATSYFMLSTIKAVTALDKGETPEWGVLKNDFNLLIKFFVTSLILSVIFIISAVLLIAPLFLAITVFFPVPYLIVMRKDLSIVEIFKKSWEMTTPQFFPCFIFILVACILILGGALLLGVGLLVTVPVVYTAGAIICNKLGAYDNPARIPAPSVSAE